LTDIKKLCAGLKNVIPVENYFERLLADCTFKDDFYKLMYVDYQHNLPNDFLVKVDRMSMANSIETRLPFLDYRLIEFMATVHKDVKMQGLEAKSVLRKTIGKQLPSELLSAPKRGFGIPLREWFKEKEFNRLLQSNLESVSGILDRSVIAKLVQQNNSGEKDNGNFIWTMVELDRALMGVEKAELSVV